MRIKFVFCFFDNIKVFINHFNGRLAQWDTIFGSDDFNFDDDDQVVYSEQSRNKEEWPIIAGLYLNRIKQGIRLQSDPTFKFCWGDKLDKVQRLLVIHREIDCPYNTYKINGLPPGPIYIPSADVVDAVLNRADVDYIFMCAKPDYSGLHNFAVSGAEHAKNAKVFQNWLGNELKKK